MKTRAGNLGNQPVAWKTAGDQLLFTTMKGLVVVEPDRIVANTTYVPPVYVEKVIVNKKEQSPGQFANYRPARATSKFTTRPWAIPLPRRCGSGTNWSPSIRTGSTPAAGAS